MTSKTAQRQAATANRRSDEVMGMMLRAWASQQGDLGEAGKRVANAIRALGDAESTSTDAINNMAEWLRLAVLNANRAAGWPDNGR